MHTFITAGRAITPTQSIEKPVLIVDAGVILEVQPRSAREIPPDARRLDFSDLILAPGFIDVHVHGGAGHDVMDADDAGLARFESHLTRHGVTAYLPTTVTAPENRLLRALEHLGRAIKGNQETGRAHACGIHLEGPFISHVKRGVHPSVNLVEPSPARLKRFWEASQGTIRLMTIAPELPGSVETIQFAHSLGISCSLGHSNATYHEAVRGIAAGATHATHTFNAMRSFDHRDPGILGAVLESDDLSADIIADGIHVDPSIVRLFLRAKGEERSVLITDAISATGMPDGTYHLGTFEVQVKDGRCLADGKLAGSVLALDQAVRNVMSFAGWELAGAVRLVSLNPARLLGTAEQRGSIEPGSRADLVVLTPDGDVINTVVGGELRNFEK